MDTLQPNTEIKDVRFAEPTFIDPLTRLYNQYYLFQFLPEEIKKAHLGNYPLAVFMLDLDGFKEVNDTYGHLCGDEVLKQLAEILKRSVRQTDMVIRYAGDEFTLLLPGVDQKKVEAIAKQLIENVDKNTFKSTEGQAIHLTTSVGFAMFPEDGNQVDKLIELADKALYLSKQKGKNRVSQAKEVTIEEISNLVAMDSFPCPRFIDRKEEIEKLQKVFDSLVVQAHLLQVACIIGEPGVGKSRLVSELHTYAQGRAVVLSCHASLTHSQNPYYLFAQGISSYIDKIGINNPQLTSLLSAIPPEELAELSRIIPSMAVFVKGHAQAASEDKKARFLLFKGLLDFLIELNKISPVVFLFDDVQWADKASIEFLKHLTKQEKNKWMFIVCCVSEDKHQNVSQDAALKGLWDEALFSDNFIQIKLPNLSLKDTAVMIEAIFPGIGQDQEFCESIHATTKGNPSFVEEVLKSLVENSTVLYQNERWQIKKGLYTQGTSFSLEEIIKKRLRSLDEETKEMIVQAAVIGEDFSVDFLKKIDNRDEGFMLELIDRAKKMHLIGESEQKGKFGFINKNVQHMLYSELNEEERAQLHRKIVKVLGEEHKDDLSNVAAEMAFHHNLAPAQDTADEYGQLLLEKTSQLFSPSEILEYLGELTKGAGGEKEKIVPLSSDSALREALKFMRALLNAIKGFHLYPPGAMRDNAIKEVFTVLEAVSAETELLKMTESEKSILINGERVALKGYEQLTLENFLTLMIDYNIKTLSFKRGVSLADLIKFLECIAMTPAQIKERGGWAGILQKEGLRSIKVEDTHSAQEFEKKDKLKDVMLMEFLLGKAGQSAVDKKTVMSRIESEPQVFAKTIQEVAKEALKEGKAKDEVKAVTESIEKINSQFLDKDLKTQGDPQKLARVIEELEPALRKKVIRAQLQAKAASQKDAASRIFQALPEHLIVDVLVEEYKETQGNILVVKDYFAKAFSGDEARKKAAIAKLEESFLKLNEDAQNIGFISGQKPWEELALPVRLHTLTTLPETYYSAELGKIKSLLDELVFGQKRQELESLTSALLEKASQLDPFARKDVITLLVYFIKAALFTDSVDSMKMQDKLSNFWNLLKSSVQPKALSVFLDIFKEVFKELNAHLQLIGDIRQEIEKPAMKKYSVFIQKSLCALSDNLQGRRSADEQIRKPIEDFVKEVFYGRLLEVWIYTLIGMSPEEKACVRGIFLLIPDRLTDTVIHFQMQRSAGGVDPFREYALKKGSADLLLELGNPAVERLTQRLSHHSKDISVPLIELVKYLKKEALAPSLSLYITHKDPLIRRNVILALSEIGGEHAYALLTQALKEEKDKRVRALIKEELNKLKSKR